MSQTPFLIVHNKSLFNPPRKFFAPWTGFVHTCGCCKLSKGIVWPYHGLIRSDWSVVKWDLKTMKTTISASLSFLLSSLAGKTSSSLNIFSPLSVILFASLQKCLHSLRILLVDSQETRVFFTVRFMHVWVMDAWVCSNSLKNPTKSMVADHLLVNSIFVFIWQHYIRRHPPYIQHLIPAPSSLTFNPVQLIKFHLTKDKRFWLFFKM